ncbi:MAG: hypothetical protein RBG13Loki_2452 [Promethearchaeota archaeon CR_4]|nr:MAG: hypothetical protein RBG13Loki_2452 [Candidatus Lokiarchaeota archaeon CR_4]
MGRQKKLSGLPHGDYDLKLDEGRKLQRQYVLTGEKYTKPNKKQTQTKESTTKIDGKGKIISSLFRVLRETVQVLLNS